MRVEVGVRYMQRAVQAWQLNPRNVNTDYLGFVPYGMVVGGAMPNHPTLYFSVSSPSRELRWVVLRHSSDKYGYVFSERRLFCVRL